MNSPVTGASINKLAATVGMHCGSRTQRNVKMKITIQKLTERVPHSSCPSEASQIEEKEMVQ